MRVIAPLVLLVMGVAFLWAAFTGRPMYDGTLVNTIKRGSRPQMPPWQARLTYTLLGLAFIGIAVGAVVQEFLRGRRA